MQKDINFAILSLVMEKLSLQKRVLLGKKSKNLRKEGFIPAVVYNSKTESKNVKLAASDANWLYRNATSTTIIDTELEGNSFKTLVKKFDVNPLTNEIIHVSLFEIDEKAPMVFTIPFNITGVSPAVKNNLGILVNVLDSIEVECALADLVPDIEIDISNLEHPGQSISVSDIKLPEGMSLINEDMEDAAIVTITEPQKIEEVEAPVVEGEEEETTEEATEEGAEEQTEEQPTE